jgi:hypothetical protein
MTLSPVCREQVNADSLLLRQLYPERKRKQVPLPGFHSGPLLMLMPLLGLYTVRMWPVLPPFSACRCSQHVRSKHYNTTTFFSSNIQLILERQKQNVIGQWFQYSYLPVSGPKLFHCTERDVKKWSFCTVGQFLHS